MALGGVVSYPSYVTHNGKQCVLAAPLPNDAHFAAILEHEYTIAKEPESDFDNPAKDCQDLLPNAPGDGRIIRKRIK